MTDRFPPSSVDGDQTARSETSSGVGASLRGRWLFAAVTILMAAAIGLFAWRSIQPSEPTRQTTPQGSVGAKVGDTAPALAVETISGSTFSLSADKPAIVFFMTVACGQLRGGIPGARAHRAQLWRPGGDPRGGHESVRAGRVPQGFRPSRR